MEDVITTAVIIEADGDPDFEGRLENWARWCYWGDDGGPQNPRICASAEGKYPIPIWEGEEPPPKEPDGADGLEIDDAVRALESAHRRVMRTHYVNLPDSWLRDQSHNRGHDFSCERADAVRARMMRWSAAQYLQTFSAARTALRAILAKRSSARGLKCA